MVKKGTSPHAKDNGAFTSLVQTAVLAGLLMCILLSTNGWPRITAAGLFWFAMSGLFSSFFGRVFLYASIQRVGSVRGSTLQKGLSPFFAVIIAYFMLGEGFELLLILGMMLIFTGMFFMVKQVYQSSQVKTASDRQVAASSHPSTPAAIADPLPSVREARWPWFRQAVGVAQTVIGMGYLYAPLAALAYAIGSVVRKKGLHEIPDPFFGAMFGAVVGVLIFSFMALWKDSYRVSIKNTFTQFQPWLFAGGLTMSCGQILNFLAVYFIEVSRVVLIGTLEIFITMFLSALVFKTNEGITRQTVLAASVVFAGTILVII